MRAFRPRGSTSLILERSMKIGELAKRARLNASAIRYYEKLGLLPAAARTSGQRHYSAESLDRVLLIRFACEMGFSLPEIMVFLSASAKPLPSAPAGKNSPPEK